LGIRLLLELYLARYGRGLQLTIRTHPSNPNSRMGLTALASSPCTKARQVWVVYTCVLEYSSRTKSRQVWTLMSSRAGPHTHTRATCHDKGKGRASDAAEPAGYYKSEPRGKQIAQVERELTGRVRRCGAHNARAAAHGHQLQGLCRALRGG